MRPQPDGGAASPSSYSYAEEAASLAAADGGAFDPSLLRPRNTGLAPGETILQEHLDGPDGGFGYCTLGLSDDEGG